LKHGVGRRTRLSTTNQYQSFFTHCDHASLLEAITAQKAHTEDDIFHIEAFASGALAPGFIVGGKQTNRPAATHKLPQVAFLRNEGRL
jgi:hypothetical protein